MKAIRYVGCTICGIPRDMEPVSDMTFDKHEGDHLWTEMQLVLGWEEKHDARQR